MQKNASGMQLRSAIHSRNHANATVAFVASGPLGLQGASRGPFWGHMEICSNQKRFFVLPEALLGSCGSNGLTSTRVLQPGCHVKCISAPRSQGRDGGRGGV